MLDKNLDEKKETHTRKLAKNLAGQHGKDTGGGYSYPLVEPRPEEVLDIDNSTLVQCTGTGRSPAHPLDVMDNAFHSQHPKDEEAGKGGDMYKSRGAGPGGTM